MRESDLEALPRISVLIGTRNRPEVLKRCLRSVLGQDYVNFEVLVLDDASDSCRVCDSIQELADPRLRCFRASDPLGVAGGRNRLMELAEGNMFFVMDDDA
jgi:glycosyltransferase involved in cell wall biosynthesis